MLDLNVDKSVTAPVRNAACLTKLICRYAMLSSTFQQNSPED